MQQETFDEPCYYAGRGRDEVMRDHFRQFAAYNAWANARLYEAALDLTEDAYRRPVGVFFGSLHGTLNHLLATDRIWLKRLTGQGEAPPRVDLVLHEDRHDLARARIAEDARLASTVAAYDKAALAGKVSYQTTSGVAHEQVVADILAHLFNHQTHHRGQAHSALSILTRREPPSLDLLQFQRGVPAPNLAARL
jgi:uncharacterized damage-inducible protein DinB